MTDQQRCTSSSWVAARSLSGGIVLLWAMWLSVTFGADPSEDRDELVRIRVTKAAGYVSLIVENHAAYDATATLAIHGDNVRIARITHDTQTYRGHSQTEAARLFAADPGKRWTYRYRLDWVKGSMHAKHDEDTLYRLPFERGESYRVIQGYNGKMSHRDHDKYAVDFAMHEGTPVCAARAGIVVDFKESSKTGGPTKRHKDQSNFVCIAHADGTFAEYHHLAYDGVLVEIGQKVEAGRRIGRSGNTGYSVIPHLHFGVYSAVDGKRLQSHPVIFTTASGTVAEPLEGRTYTAK